MNVLRRTAYMAAMTAALVVSTQTVQAQPAPVNHPAVIVRGVDHVGINVPNIEQATAFFADTFGFKLVSDMKDVPLDDGFKKTFDIHGTAKKVTIRMLRAGNGANLELFAFTSPDASNDQPHYDDAASSHVAFYTDNIDASVAALRARGVRVLTDPIRMTSGPTAG
jgi:catechol 2,3-dioxygenase-like lactoylglutathione lyase family enzyme